ncbi:MAG: efflux RND transporter permease subunit [Microthrixaceae bacterium]
MPIAILDSIHVLSEFFDRYPHHLDRRETLRVVYGELYRPLAFTSLTTGVAFASLAIAPIPPVRVFGLFVAFGVATAWLATIMVIPAVIMRMSETRLAAALEDRPESSGRLLAGGLRGLGRASVRFRWPIVAGFAVLAVAAVPFITQIQVNDNPVNWFKSSSEVREATEALNERLPGTFGANLIVTAEEPGGLNEEDARAAVQGLQEALAGSDVVGSTAAYVQLEDLDAAGPVTATLIDTERQRANLRLQLSDGDNQAMRSVVELVDDHLEADPLPAGVEIEWAGETYLNLVWQDEMVTGMLEAFVSTLLIVLLLMAIVFRSLRWAVLSVLPVAWTVIVVYGVIGLVGKDYDMPIAVLSTLVLGIGVDFAIHFVQRFRELDAEFGDRRAALRAFFEEPARALTRNALVIAIGFTPLFLASLTPYLVVAAFLSSIILLSWLTTLVLLPAVVAGPDAPDVPEGEPIPPHSHRRHPEPVEPGTR